MKLKEGSEREGERNKGQRREEFFFFIFSPTLTETVGVIKGWQGFVSGAREVAQVGWLA